MLKKFLLCVSCCLGGIYLNAAEALEPADLLPKAGNGLISAMTQTSQYCFAVGERGHVFRSKDPEKGWEQIPSPAKQFLSSVTSNSQDEVWLAGYDGLILYSKDQGNAWLVQHFDAQEDQALLDILMLDDGIGLAVGTYGLMLHTSDFGRNWKRLRVLEEDPHLYAIRYANEAFYIAGEFSTLLKLSRDAEKIESWSSGGEATFFGLEVVDDESCLTYGLAGRLWKVGLDSIEQVQEEKGTIWLGSFKRKGLITLYGTEGSLLMWTPAGQRNEKLTFSGDLTGALETEAGMLFSTTQGFFNWKGKV